MSQSSRNHPSRSEAALLFVVLVWGINFPIVKAVLEIMHPHVLNILRFVVSTIVLAGLYVYRQRRVGKPVLSRSAATCGRLRGWVFWMSRSLPHRLWAAYWL